VPKGNPAPCPLLITQDHFIIYHSSFYIYHLKAHPHHPDRVPSPPMPITPSHFIIYDLLIDIWYLDNSFKDKVLLFSSLCLPATNPPAIIIATLPKRSGQALW